MSLAAKSAKPAWAITAWVDDNNVYTEIPATSGPPLIQKWPLTEAGLSKALNQMRTFHHSLEPLGGSYNITQQARPKPMPLSKGVTQAQREKAVELLRKMKIV